MTAKILARWEEEFRRAASADGLSGFRDHLRRLGLPDLPHLLLEGTVRVVQTCCAHAAMDGRKKDFAELLAMQTYQPSQATEARYAYTFDLSGKAFARILVRANDNRIDLADLYGAPWNDDQTVGFRRLWISHPDWSPLTNEETTEIEEVISKDLRFDYSEDELQFWSNDSLDETYLYVHLQDVDQDDSD